MQAWDEFENFSEPAAAPAVERELVPEGTHTFQIKEVIDGDRLELRLALEDRRYGWVFCRLPRGADWARRIFGTLPLALGMSREEWAACEVTDLAGRQVGAAVYHKVDKQGKTWVNVRQFVTPEAQAEPAPKAKPRSQAKKADATFKSNGGGDDIPF
jgi:hypothetical protein